VWRQRDRHGGTPAPLVAHLDAAIAKALAEPEVCDTFAGSLLKNSHVSRATP